MNVLPAIAQRIREIHETIGEDNPVLDPSEQVNDEAMYAIYGGDTSILDDDGSLEETIDLTEAEEILRAIQREHPKYYNQISNLPNGLRSARRSTNLSGSIVFGEVNRASLSLQEGLLALRCAADEPRLPLSSAHNEVVVQVQLQLDQIAASAVAQGFSKPRLTLGQSYAVQQLEQQYRTTSSDERREQIELLTSYLRATLPRAVNRELNALRRQAVQGEELFAQLVNLTLEYQLAELYSQQKHDDRRPIIPHLIVSVELH